MTQEQKYILLGLAFEANTAQEDVLAETYLITNTINAKYPFKDEKTEFILAMAGLEISEAIVMCYKHLHNAVTNKNKYNEHDNHPIHMLAYDAARSAEARYTAEIVFYDKWRDLILVMLQDIQRGL